MLYLGSLALMFVSAFWSIDDFTGQLVKEFTLDNFEQLFTDPSTGPWRSGPWGSRRR